MNKREFNRPIIDQSERPCYCGRPYRYAWSWALVLPERRLIDLCAKCSRVARYGTEEEKIELIEAVIEQIETLEGRICAPNS
jgi:hypothetical protein